MPENDILFDITKDASKRSLRKEDVVDVDFLHTRTEAARHIQKKRNTHNLIEAIEVKRRATHRLVHQGTPSGSSCGRDYRIDNGGYVLVWARKKR